MTPEARERQLGAARVRRSGSPPRDSRNGAHSPKSTGGVSGPAISYAA